MKILYVIVALAAVAAFFLYKKMKDQKPIVPMTTSEPLPVDYLDDSDGNGNGDDGEDLVGPVGDYSMSPNASALTARTMTRGYMAWYPGNR